MHWVGVEGLRQTAAGAPVLQILLAKRVAVSLAIHADGLLCVPCIKYRWGSRWLTSCSKGAAGHRVS
jgi:hypothetical protein